MSSASYSGRAARPASRPSVSATTLWAGGAATAAVAAFGYAVGVVIARGVFDVPVLAPERAGVTGDASTWWFAAIAFAAALVATALLHVLLLVTPRPFSFFGWIVGLATTLVTVLPFTQRAKLDAQVATAIINLVVGIMIGSLLRGVGARALRPPRQPMPAGPTVIIGGDSERYGVIGGDSDRYGGTPGYNDGYRFSPFDAPESKPMPPADPYGN